MSSADEHHEKAEQLLSAAGKEPNSTSRSLLLAEAQVHATLALSAPAGKGWPGAGQPETGYALPGWGRDQGSSDGSAGSGPQPHALPGETSRGSRFPKGQHPVPQAEKRRAEERRARERAAPQSAPPERDTPPPPPFEPGPGGPGKREPGQTVQSPVPGNPDDQKPGDFTF